MTNLLTWLKRCTVCPNACGIDRTAGERGRCRTADEIKVSAADLHFGEEPCLVGRGGSGTIFFTACNLGCVFCQNYDISQLDRGRQVDSGELLKIMLGLQLKGAVNINLVSPTHLAPQIFEVTRRARSEGLVIPIVYNCGGYENPEFIRELDGLVDIYMPDFKYGSDQEAFEYSGIERYTESCMTSIAEMHRQVGELEFAADGTAIKGLLVRHLVLPNRIAGSMEIIDFLVSEVSPATFLNIMDQYRPAYRASEHSALARRARRSEINEVIEYARYRGMSRLLV
jgi:putative pyruvate formate lyase activating enzyme